MVNTLQTDKQANAQADAQAQNAPTPVTQQPGYKEARSSIARVILRRTLWGLGTVVAGTLAVAGVGAIAASSAPAWVPVVVGAASAAIVGGAGWKTYTAHGEARLRRETYTASLNANIIADAIRETNGFPPKPGYAQTAEKLGVKTFDLGHRHDVTQVGGNPDFARDLAAKADELAARKELAGAAPSKPGQQRH